MLTLVIDTATAACSVALIASGEVIAQTHEIVGRGHAERLLPMIAELPGGGRAGRILVDCGPGSFTGVRVGIAAARALGLGWGADTFGYSSLALLAAMGFADNSDWPMVAAVLEGGHGEVFMQVFTDPPLTAIDALASCTPADARTALGDLPAIGSGVGRLAPLAPTGALIDRLPRAADAILLPLELARLAPRPIYGRAPDAVPAPLPVPLPVHR